MGFLRLMLPAIIQFLVALADSLNESRLKGAAPGEQVDATAASEAAAAATDLAAKLEKLK